MANIASYLNDIKNAIFGKEVRGSIHDGIKVMNDEVESTTARQKYLESTFDQLVINAGNSNAEIVDARVESGGTSYKKLGDRLNKFDEQFNTIENEIKTVEDKTVSRFSKGNNSAIVTFIDDDSSISVMEKWKPICDTKGIKITLAVVTGTLNYEDGLKTENLKTLINQGHSIANHGHNSRNFNTETLDRLREDIELANTWFDNNGIKKPNIFVYPSGLTTEDETKKGLVAEYFSYGVTTTNTLNKSIYDSYYITRVTSDYTSLEDLKLQVDKAIANKSWLIFMSHCWSDGFDSAKISSLIDYIKEKNVAILNFDEAEKLKGVKLQVASKNSNKFVFVGKDGNSNLERVLKEYVVGVDIPYSTGYANIDNSKPPTVRLHSDGTIQMSVYSKCTDGSSTLIFTLPSELRPKIPFYAILKDDFSTMRKLRIDVSGNVYNESNNVSDQLYGYVNYFN